MNDTERRFHETWLGMVQPSEGLVVSVAVLVENQCMAKQARDVQEALQACVRTADKQAIVTEPEALLASVLSLTNDVFDAGPDLPKPLRLYVPEGKQELRPTRALKRRALPKDRPKEEADLPAAAVAGQDYAALFWDVPPEVELDKPETVTGPWAYPAQAKFDRLLRECRVPIGVLSERIYCAPANDPTPMAAILILTGSSGSEGTLGGLIEQGRRIDHHLRRAFELAELCSNDPVCASHKPGEDDHSERFLEGAACHGCLYIAESSCEKFNSYLDRALVVPVIGRERELAFFQEAP